MKKLLSVLVAIALCAAFSICAFAVDGETTTVNEKTVEDIFNGISDLVNAEADADDAALEQAIEDLYANLQDANVSGDFSALAGQLKDYAEGADVDASKVFSDLGAVQDVFEKFLVDGGFDLDAIKGDLQESSALNTLVGLYTGGYTNIPDPKTTTSTTPTLPPNPETADSTVTGVVIAASVLAISATAAVVAFGKKKED